jgi:hypothetical protein
MQHRILILIAILGVVSCTRVNRELPGLAEADQPLYLTNSAIYNLDQREGRLQREQVRGIVVKIDLNGKMNYPLAGTKEMRGLDSVLLSHPDWYPILTTYFGESVFGNFCQDTYDGQIHRLGTWFKELDRPAGITIGFQVDSPVWKLPAETVKSGIRCFADKLREVGLRDVSVGLHVSSMYSPKSVAGPEAYYAGDKYVDFIGVDLSRFTDMHFESETSVFTRSNLPSVFDLADEKKVPVVILDANPTAVYQLLPSSADGVYDEFYDPLDSLLKNFPAIIAYSVSPGAIPDSTSRQLFLDRNK